MWREATPLFSAYITGLLTDYVAEQRAKDAEVAKQMLKVIERITNEIVKPANGGVKNSDRNPFSKKENVLYSHRGQGRRFFPGNVFPSGLIHSAVTHWANRKDIQIGDSLLEAFDGSYYRVEKVKGTDFGYQITKKYESQNFEEVLKEYERTDSKKSPKSEFDEGVARYRETVGYGQAGYHADSSGTGYRGENGSVHGVVLGENGRRGNSGQAERDRKSGLRDQRQTGRSIRLEWTPQELYDKMLDLDRNLVFAEGRYATSLKNKRDRYGRMIDEMNGWDKVRLSERGTSNRHLLANAFEGISQNSKEYEMIQEYEYKNLVQCYEGYKALKGNSFIDHIYEEMQEWDII